MKKVKFLMAALMLTMGLTASAQKGISKGWNTVYLQYSPGSVNNDEKEADNESYNAFSLGYNRAISLSSSIPLYLEVGGALQYSFKTIEDDEEFDDYATLKYKYNLWSLKVPVSVLYDFKISNSKVHIAPFAGMTFRYNLSGKCKQELEMSSELEDYMDEYGYDLDEIYEEYENEYDLFDKDDMDKDGVFKRLQVGYQIGVSARFNNKFMASIAYNGDFSEISKKVKVSQWNFTLGYCF